MPNGSSSWSGHARACSSERVTSSMNSGTPSVRRAMMPAKLRRQRTLAGTGSAPCRRRRRRAARPGADASFASATHGASNPSRVVSSSMSDVTGHHGHHAARAARARSDRASAGLRRPGRAARLRPTAGSCSTSIDSNRSRSISGGLARVWPDHRRDAGQFAEQRQGRGAVRSGIARQQPRAAWRAVPRGRVRGRAAPRRAGTRSPGRSGLSSSKAEAAKMHNPRLRRRCRWRGTAATRRDLPMPASPMTSTVLPLDLPRARSPVLRQHARIRPAVVERASAGAPPPERSARVLRRLRRVRARRGAAARNRARRGRPDPRRRTARRHARGSRRRSRCRRAGAKLLQARREIWGGPDDRAPILRHRRTGR